MGIIQLDITTSTTTKKKMEALYSKALFLALLSVLAFGGVNSQSSWEQRFVEETGKIANKLTALAKPMKDQKVVDGANALAGMIQDFLATYGAPVYNDQCLDDQFAMIDKALEIIDAIEGDKSAKQLYDTLYDLLGWID